MRTDNRYLRSMLKSPTGAVFLSALILSIAVGFFVQFVLLPVLLPGLHAGHGLLVGGDWVRFHKEAIKLADAINADGWQSFELRPKHNAPIAVAAVFYVLTGVREPWVLIPLHGMLFALAATGLFKIYRCIAVARPAVFAVAPFVLFPSSIVLYSQIHKDVWTIAGFVWLLYVAIVYAGAGRLPLRRHMALAGIAILASASVWLMRPYLLAMFLVGLLCAGAFLLVWTLCGRWFHRSPERRGWLRASEANEEPGEVTSLRPLLRKQGGDESADLRLGSRQRASWTGIALCAGILLAFAADMPTAIATYWSPGLAAKIRAPNVVEKKAGGPPILRVTLPAALRKQLTEEQRDLLWAGEVDEVWPGLTPQQKAAVEQALARGRPVLSRLTPDDHAMTWLPRPLRRRVVALIAERRDAVLFSLPSGSMIDGDVPMRNLGEMVRYVPRALEISLFAPMPRSWFTAGVSPGSRMMRSVAGVEMMLSYALLAGIPVLLALAKPDQRKAVLFACAFVLPILCILAISYPNVGTLYRMRYGYLQTLAGFGAIGWSLLHSRLQELRPSRAVGATPL